MALNLVNAPASGRSLRFAQTPFKTRAASCTVASRSPCTCQLGPQYREITLTDKAVAGATAALLSFGAFACQPALADLNKFEAAAGGEFGVGTAAQYGEAELRGKDFSGQVSLEASFCHEVHVLIWHIQTMQYFRISEGPILPQPMRAMQISKALSCKVLTSSKQ